MQLMSNNNKSIVKATPAAKAVEATTLMGLDTAAARFVDTFGSYGEVLAERVRIVMGLREQNPDAKANRVYLDLEEAVKAKNPNAVGRYSGWKRASLERYGTIGEVIAKHGWTLDAHTAHSLSTLIEDNRPAVRALLTANKRQPGALDTLVKATAKAKADKAAATKAAAAAKRVAAKADAPAVAEETGYTPAALLASITETVGAQTWTDEEVGVFAASLTEYAASLASLVVSA